MSSALSVGDDVVIVGGAFAGEAGVIVAIEDGQATVELMISGRPTRMAFDASALSVASRDPRAPLRRELEDYFAQCAREDMIRWFASREEDEDPVETDELACLYQIASPIRREYLRIREEFDETFRDAAGADDVDAANRLWNAKKPGWWARLTPSPIDVEERRRGTERMDLVRAAVPSQDEDEDEDEVDDDDELDLN